MAKNNLETAYLGGGCFWCLEAIYQRVKGVESVVSGYSGGDEAPAKLSFLRPGKKNAEVVQIKFDPEVVSYSKLLEIFWHIHDPTTFHRQNYDIGPQYRSIILAVDEKQRKIAIESKDDIASKLWEDPIVTEVTSFKEFYRAEDYHQNFYNNNPNAGYCQIIINPKVAKLEQKFSNLLKS